MKLPAGTEFIYLHGFASSPQSKKATLFRQRFRERGLSMTTPDLEAGGFRTLTITGQVAIVEQLIEDFGGQPCALIGSSMGGYLATLVAQRRPEVAALYLMCPGFNFLSRWRQKLPKGDFPENRFPPLLKVFHYRYNKVTELETGIFTDAARWEPAHLDRDLPTRIVHGIQDETVPIEESRGFATTRPWVSLAALDSDHSLLSHIDWILEDCLKFFGVAPSGMEPAR